MSPVLVVIADVFVQQSSQVPLVQNDHMVKQLPTHTPNPSLGDAILPRTTKSSSDRFCSIPFDARDDVRGELRVAVEDQEPVWLIVSPSFAHLQYDPQRVWRTGHVAMQDFAPVVANDEETVQDTKRQRGHGEEIESSDYLTMIS
jgi:hypothetical protein